MAYLGPEFPLIPPGAVPGTSLDTATQAKINGAVQKAGDNMSGSLTMNGVPTYYKSGGANGMIGAVFTSSTNAILGVFQLDTGFGMGFVNAAQTNWNFYVNDAGNMTVRGSAVIGSIAQAAGLNLVASYPAIQLFNVSSQLTARIQGNTGSIPGGWGSTNAANTVWTMQVDDAGNVIAHGTITCTQVRVVSGTYTPSLSINTSPNWIGFLNSASNVWLFNVADATGNATIAGGLSTGGSITGIYRMILNRSGSSSGELAFQAGDGSATWYMRARAGAVGGYEQVNNAYSAVITYTDDSGNMACRGLTQTSDYRLKKNVQKIDPADGLNRIMAMRPIEFDWIDEGTASKGFLAHELQAVEPTAVKGKKDAMQDSPDGKSKVILPQTMSLNPIVADLVAAVQALQARIVELEAKVA